MCQYTARALAVVRFGHRPPARPLQTRPQTGPIIHCAAKLHQCVNSTVQQTKHKMHLYMSVFQYFFLTNTMFYFQNSVLDVLFTLAVSSADKLEWQIG